MSTLPTRSVASKWLKCPAIQAGKCAGTIANKRRMATEAVPLTSKNKKEGDISSLTTGFEEQVRKSWNDLVEVLKVRTEEVATKREAIIPQVQSSDIEANTVPSSSIEAVRRTGVAVIRGVMPKDSTEALLEDV
ncbi:hypothetical protein FLAG1_12230, partial [Fusarium langsethiae]